jgi:hypothetical protein
MAAKFPNIGSKSTVAFTTTGFTTYTAGLLGVELSGMTRAAIDTAVMSTAGQRPFIPGDTFDGGSIVLTCAFNADTDPEALLTAAVESVTINLANDAGTKAKWVFNGFAIEVGVSVPHEEMMVTTVTLKNASAFAHTASA